MRRQMCKILWTLFILQTNGEHFRICLTGFSNSFPSFFIRPHASNKGLCSLPSIQQRCILMQALAIMHRRQNRLRRRGQSKHLVFSRQQQGVLEHYKPVDVSAVEVEGDILKDCIIWFANSGSTSKVERESLVARLGGKVGLPVNTSLGQTVSHPCV